MYGRARAQKHSYKLRDFAFHLTCVSRLKKKNCKYEYENFSYFEKMKYEYEN